MTLWRGGPPTVPAWARMMLPEGSYKHA